jgi:hypothetical protein
MSEYAWNYLKYVDENIINTDRKRMRERTIELYKKLKYKLRNYFNRASKEYLLNMWILKENEKLIQSMYNINRRIKEKKKKN